MRRDLLNAKLDPDRVRSLQEQGLTNVEIGKRLNASRSAVWSAAIAGKARREAMRVVQPPTRPDWRPLDLMRDQRMREALERCAEIRAIRSLVE